MINPDANIKSQRRDWLLKRQEYLRERNRIEGPKQFRVDELERIYAELRDGPLRVINPRGARTALEP